MVRSKRLMFVPAVLHLWSFKSIILWKIGAIQGKVD